MLPLYAIAYSSVDKDASIQVADPVVEAIDSSFFQVTFAVSVSISLTYQFLSLCIYTHISSTIILIGSCV